MMLENTAFSAFLERFPEDIQLILREMIPSYQQGYLDYVYQTDKPEIQARRIKNLVKNFRMMDYTFVMSLPQDLALEIVSDWHYPPGFTGLLNPTRSELLDAKAREGRDFAVIWNGRLLGHFRLDNTDKGMLLYLALKPKYIGQGWGPRFYQTIEDFLVKQGNIRQITVMSRVASHQVFFENQGFKKRSEKDPYLVKSL